MSVIRKRDGNRGDREGNNKKTKSDSLQPLETYAYNPDWEVDKYYDVALRRQDQTSFAGVAFTVGRAYDEIFASSLDGDRLAVTSGDCIWLWTPEGRALLSVDEGDWDVSCLAFSPNGEMLASGYRNGAFRIWNTSPEHEKFGTCLFKASPHIYEETESVVITSIAWSSDGKKVAIGTGYESRIEAENFTDGSIFVWHVDHIVWSIVCKIEDFAGGPCLSFSPDGMMIVSGYLNDVKVWDLNKRSDGSIACLRKFNLPDHVTSVLFSPDGKMIASGCVDGTVKVCSVDEQSTPITFGQKYPEPRRPYPYDINDDDSDDDDIFYLTSGTKVSVMFSPDGSILAAKHKTQIILWDVQTGLCLKTFKERAELNLYSTYQHSIYRAVCMSFFERDNETYFRHAFLKNRLKNGYKTPEAKVRFTVCKPQWWLKDATIMLTGFVANARYPVNNAMLMAISDMYPTFYDGTYYYILNMETNKVEKYTAKGLMAWIKKKRRRAIFKPSGDPKHKHSSAKALEDLVLQLRF